MKTYSVLLTKIVDAVDCDQVHSAESAERGDACDDADGEMGHALCSRRLRDAPAANSSRLENPAVAISSHISAGMLSRWSHDLTVVIGRLVSSTIRS